MQVGHPLKLSNLMDPELKDDDRNNLRLADMLRVVRFPPAYYPFDAYVARDVLRRREDLGQKTGDMNRHIRSLVHRSKAIIRGVITYICVEVSRNSSRVHTTNGGLVDLAARRVEVVALIAKISTHRLDKLTDGDTVGVEIALFVPPSVTNEFAILLL